MNQEEFEKQLKERPMRPVPAEWRAEILSAAKAAAVSESNESAKGESFFSAVKNLLAQFRPSPQARVALAGVWIVIVALHFSTGDESRGVSKDGAEPVGAVAQLREQKMFFAELIGLKVTPDVEPPKSAPRPRSERRYHPVFA